MWSAQERLHSVITTKYYSLDTYTWWMICSIILYSVCKTEQILVVIKSSHLSKLYVMCQSNTHFDKPRRSACSHNTSSTESTDLWYHHHKAFVMCEKIFFGRSLINNRKNNGPKTESWGTPRIIHGSLWIWFNIYNLLMPATGIDPGEVVGWGG